LGRFGGLTRIGNCREKGDFSGFISGRLGAGLGFGQPAAAEFFLRDVGKVGFDVEDGGAVEHVNAANVEGGAVAAEEFDVGEGDGIGTARRAGGEDAMRAVVTGRRGDEVVTLGLVEKPKDAEVREAFDVGEAGGEFGQDFQGAFDIVLRSKASGDIASLGVGGDGVSDRLRGEHGLILVYW
jgi:hypothetical protein